MGDIRVLSSNIPMQISSRTKIHTNNERETNTTTFAVNNNSIFWGIFQ